MAFANVSFIELAQASTQVFLSADLDYPAVAFPQESANFYRFIMRIYKSEYIDTAKWIEYFYLLNGTNMFPTSPSLEHLSLLSV